MAAMATPTTMTTSATAGSGVENREIHVFVGDAVLEALPSYEVEALMLAVASSNSAKQYRLLGRWERDGSERNARLVRFHDTVEAKLTRPGHGASTELRLTFALSAVLADEDGTEKLVGTGECFLPTSSGPLQLKTVDLVSRGGGTLMAQLNVSVSFPPEVVCQATTAPSSSAEAPAGTGTGVAEAAGAAGLTRPPLPTPLMLARAGGRTSRAPSPAPAPLPFSNRARTPLLDTSQSSVDRRAAEEEYLRAAHERERREEERRRKVGPVVSPSRLIPSQAHRSPLCPLLV